MIKIGLVDKHGNVRLKDVPEGSPEHLEAARALRRDGRSMSINARGAVEFRNAPRGFPKRGYVVSGLRAAATAAITDSLLVDREDAKPSLWEAGLKAGKVLSVSAPSCVCPINAAKMGAACECNQITVTVQDSLGGVRVRTVDEGSPEHKTALAALSTRRDGGDDDAFRRGMADMAAVLARGTRPTGQGPLTMTKDPEAPATALRPKDHARPRPSAPKRPPGMPASYEADRAQDATKDLQVTKGKKS